MARISGHHGENQVGIRILNIIIHLNAMAVETLTYEHIHTYIGTYICTFSTDQDLT